MSTVVKMVSRSPDQHLLATSDTPDYRTGLSSEFLLWTVAHRESTITILECLNLKFLVVHHLFYFRLFLKLQNK